MTGKCVDCRDFQGFSLTTNPADVLSQLTLPRDAEVATTLIAAIATPGQGLRTCHYKGIGPGCLECPINSFVRRGAASG